MTAASDDQIVEALDSRWPSFPFERFKDSDGIPSLASVYAQEVAEQIEPIIKARVAEAWDEGSAYGISFQAGGSWVDNPYRTEPKP